MTAYYIPAVPALYRDRAGCSATSPSPRCGKCSPIAPDDSAGSSPSGSGLVTGTDFGLTIPGIVVDDDRRLWGFARC